MKSQSMLTFVARLHSHWVQRRSVILASGLLALAAMFAWQTSARFAASAKADAVAKDAIAATTTEATEATEAAEPLAQGGGCNNCCGSWSQKSSAGPIARDIHAMAYAQNCNRVVMFGGRMVGGVPPANVTDETWEWNGNTMTWAQFTPATRPAARGQHAMAYDEARNEVVLFGGYNSSFGGLNDTWVYSCATHTWTQKFPANSPSIRHGHAMAYDPNKQLVVMYGGGNNKQDTWTWDGTNWTEIVGANQPGIRHEHAMAFDGTRVILFGGSKNAGLADNDTWDLTLTSASVGTWTMIAANGTGPNKRQRHGMAYDPGCRKVILFGGNSDIAAYANDTWEWRRDTLSWCQTSVPTPPSTRQFPAMAYDGKGVLVNGGLNSGLSQIQDTWRFVCNRPYTYRAGRMDNFNLPTDPTSPTAAFAANINSAYATPPKMDFDEPTQNKFLLHSFTGLPANIVRAELEVRAIPGPGAPNDSIHLDFPPFNAPSFTWSKNFFALHPGGTWSDGQGASVFTLDLCNLPAGGAGQPTNLIGLLNANQSLHVLVQDDTKIDYIKLRVWTCPPRKYFGGLPHEPFNGTTLDITTSPSGVEQMQILPSPTGRTDVKTVLGQVSGWQANFLPVSNLVQSGKVFESWVKGRVGGVDDQFIGRSTITGNGSSATFSADFSNIGSTTSFVELLDANGQMVGSFTAPNAAAIQFMCPAGTQTVTVCRSEWRCETNGNDSNLVTFYDTTCVGFGGQNYANVSTMRVTALGITQPREFVSEGVICGANLGPVTVTSEALYAVGRCPMTNGGVAGFEAFAGNLAVSNIGSSGEDGVSVSLGQSQSFSISLDDIDPMGAAPGGATLQISTSHILNALPPPPPRTDIVNVARWIIGNVSIYGITSDFSGLGATSSRVVAFSGNTQVADVTNFNGMVISSAWPTGFSHNGTSTLGYELIFPPSTSISFNPCPPAPCGTLTNITSLRILPQNPNVTVSHLTETRLTAANLSEFTITEATMVPFCPNPITVSPGSLPVAGLNQAYNQQVTASGGRAPYRFSVSSGTLNAGLSLDTLTGRITGTPTSLGSAKFDVTATDDNGCTGVQSYTIDVIVCPTITVNPPTASNGFVGTAYSQTFTASGGNGPYSFARVTGTLPPGLSLTVGGALTGTPTTAGTFNFTVEATAVNGCKGSLAYTVIISGNGLMFYPLPTPVRLNDTRPGFAGCSTPGVPITGGTSMTQAAAGFCGIPSVARAIMGNITVVNPAAIGYLTLFPSNATQPTVANTNFNPADVLNNVFTVGLGAADGAFKIFASSTTHVVVDVTGYFAPPTPPPAANGLYFHPLPVPVRLEDTRPGQTACVAPGMPLTGGVDTIHQGTTTCNGVTIPSVARAMMGNITVVNPAANGFLTVFPGGVPRPTVATGNYRAGAVLNSPFTVGLSPTGQFNVYSTATTHVVIDVLGYFSPDLVDVNGVGLLFTPIIPARLVDSRPGQSACFNTGMPLVGGVDTTQAAAGSCTIASVARAIMGNITVVNPAASGYLTLWPSDTTRPLIATSNYQAGRNFNRFFTTGLGAANGAFKMFAFSTTHIVIDVSGYFAP
ncbi:MAG: putative Ig domain-containing protein [Blastocatellia bacterium]